MEYESDMLRRLSLIAAAALLIHPRVARAQDASLEAALRQTASLAGEPAIVSAAGLAPDDTPNLTIENPWAFDSAVAKRRVVLVGADDVPAANAVIAAVKWLKTAAPRPLRTAWAVSAMPLARFAATDALSLNRWVTFQAPDIVVEFGAGGVVHTAGVRVESVPVTGSIEAFRKILESAAATPVGIVSTATPSRACAAFPFAISCAATDVTVFDGTAKPTPSLPPDSLSI